MVKKNVCPAWYHIFQSQLWCQGQTNLQGNWRNRLLTSAHALYLSISAFDWQTKTQKLQIFWHHHLFKSTHAYFLSHTGPFHCQILHLIVCFPEFLSGQEVPLSWYIQKNCTNNSVIFCSGAFLHSEILKVLSAAEPSQDSSDSLGQGRLLQCA